MPGEYFHQQVFSKEHLQEQPPTGNEYEGCTFENCEFADVSFSSAVFADCIFYSCNLSNARLTKTAFRNVTFNNCKLLALHFEDCNPFGLSFGFENCVLDHSSFYKLNLPETVFRKTSLRETDFTESNFSKAVFEECDLLDAHFENTSIEQADLRTAVHFRINPSANKIRQARFSSHNLAGLLSAFDILID